MPIAPDQPKDLATLLMGGERQAIQLGSAGQELFCQYMAAGFEPNEAYAKAYNADPNHKEVLTGAYRLARAPHIVARTMQIRTDGIKGFVVERHFLLENLLWAVNTARQRGDVGTVRKAIMDIGKLYGLVVDKLEASVMGQFQVMKDVTINGESLVFDVGSGAPLHIKGTLEEPEPRLSSTYDIMTAPDATKTIDAPAGVDTFEALQNSTKTLPAQSVMLNDEPLPLDARLNAGPGKRVDGKKTRAQPTGIKMEGGGSGYIRRRKDIKPLPATPEDDMEDAMREERIAAYGEDLLS